MREKTDRVLANACGRTAAAMEAAGAIRVACRRIGVPGVPRRSLDG